ncbi:MAG: sensor histidine kinase [Stenomitos frigidus ULC029]
MLRLQRFSLQIAVMFARKGFQGFSVSFTDNFNGSGIPKEIQPRIFNPFFTTKPVGKGTGRGMSISHQIITEKHQGKLICLSTPGKGAEFIIQIPM